MKNTVSKNLGYKCFRCGSVALVDVDMGKAGKIHLCPVCWVGLAGCLTRDFDVYMDFSKDYIMELDKVRAREEFLKKVKKGN